MRQVVELFSSRPWRDVDGLNEGFLADMSPQEGTSCIQKCDLLVALESVELPCPTRTPSGCLSKRACNVSLVDDPLLPGPRPLDRVRRGESGLTCLYGSCRSATDRGRTTPRVCSVYSSGVFWMGSLLLKH